MEAGKRTINDIFNGNRILEIPFFQRAYVWGEEQWERLLEDLEHVSQSNKPYFLGSVILKQQPTPAGSQVGDKRILIDGQQRLTTLNLLMKVLCLKNNQNASFDRVFRLMSNDLALWHNHNDIDTFNKILNLDSLEEIEGKDSITGAYNFFKENADPTKLNLNNILTNIMFVGIDLGTDEDEQQIFDTINSLGVRLTTAELLKNYFFNRDDISNYNANWKDVFEKDDETKDFWDRAITAGRSKRENIDLFFYSFLQIKVQEPELDVSSEDKKQYTKVEGLFESFKHFITDYGVDKDALIQEIKEYAKLYRDNIDFSITGRELSNTNSVERINAIMFGLETTTIIPYVLYVLRNVSDQNDRDSIFSYLESYLMRRMVCHASTKNYNQFFTERLIANNITSLDSLKSQIATQEGKINYMPTNDELLEGFQNSRLVNKQTLGIIYMLESKIRDRARHSTALLGMSNYSLEHIMPKKWPNNWPACASEEDRIKRNRKLLTLGNLAIITSSLNSSIRDANWNDKRNGKGNKHGLRHFAAGLETLSDSYLNKDVWDESIIDERAVFLFNKAKDIWNL
ncbi:MAG: hypothetical protein CMP67_05860 [Flavobacteriales bacterium]|nr:hypothetical protein [Flavobacteriales bacterium]|tara:strand:- start:6377 stop:8089 length:1713 start_codon:yes stop_codon:yes gene_type:complete